MDKIEKFLELISSCDKHEKLKLFSILINEMKKDVIGYHKVFDDEFELIIDIDEKIIESFKPLGSLGLSHSFIFERELKLFPDGKTLHDMLEDPLYFSDWCVNNLK